MNKYDPLRKWLTRQSKDQITVTFDELERILGSELPVSARRYPDWWDNREITSVDRPAHCQAWREAGFRTTRPDFYEGKVVFTKMKAT